MSQPAEQFITIDDLSKGMNTYDPDGRVPKGFYVDAVNMLLTNKAPITMAGSTKLNTTTAPAASKILWFEPYTDSAGVSSFIVACDDGFMRKYVVGTDTWTTLITITASAIDYTHTPFRGQLIFTNGTDAIRKYDGTNVLPVGGLLVADWETDETWTNGAADTTNVYEGTQSRGSLTNGVITYIDYTTAKDFLTGINGGTSFAATDSFEFYVKRTAGAGTSALTVRFGNTADTVYFQATATATDTSNWQKISILRSAFALTGVPVWSSIERFKVSHATAGNTLSVDHAYWIYKLAPAIGKFIELYAQQLVVSGITADPVEIIYSDPGTPDEFPAANIARFSGGRHIFEKTDQITALRAYFDELIVGKVNSAWTFSGTGTNISISALPLTIGVDGHRAIAETPWSLHFLFENNIFGARLTSRGLVSTNISSLLTNLDGTNLQKNVTIRHDRTHTVRWGLRENSTSQNSLGLIYDYTLDAWASRYNGLSMGYLTRAIVNGNREILACSQQDGYIYRLDVGTTFSGTAITSSVTLPWLQSKNEDGTANVVRWINGQFYLKNAFGTGSATVYAAFADDPTEFDGASFTSFGSINTSSMDADKGFITFGRTSRWIQIKLECTSGGFECQVPVIIGFNPTPRRV